jgi:hypothetical protein
MATKTAVDYLVKEFSEILGKIATHAMQDLLMVDAINNAKELQEQQIKDAFNQGYRDGELDAESNTFDGDVSEFSNAYDYYFQTYGGGDE